MKATCSRCHERPRQARHRYCRECKNAHQRAWRRTHPLNPEQRRKDIARSFVSVALSRGRLARQPCRDCGATPAEAHHKDYAKPLEVEWLCRPCHRAHHRHGEVA